MITGVATSVKKLCLLQRLSFGPPLEKFKMITGVATSVKKLCLRPTLEADSFCR